MSTYTTSKIGNWLGESVFTSGLEGEEKHKGLETLIILLYTNWSGLDKLSTLV